ncbi:hypothetical protein BGZ99_007378 [Dissophora globulifera]|uniref:Uncharacterized protein n=1 Tax=Dissophora globulifera TaxID=979702 RepID=A0A9P6RS09_9FUNG|nr:hypothetical protein BGZ99_007378 [Dissophora globulifera]
MTATRKSTRSKAAAAVVATPTSESETVPKTDNAAAVAEKDPSSSATPSGVDSTHQAHESEGLKEDQKQETADLGMGASSSTAEPELLNTERLNEAASTPINKEIDEVEPVSELAGPTEHKEVEVKSTLPAPEEAVPKPMETTHLGTTAMSDSVGTVTDAATTAAMPQMGSDHLTTAAMPQMGTGHLVTPAAGDMPQMETGQLADDKVENLPTDGLETTKHAKRPIEFDSNTVTEELDYSAGAYKSPFRHTHKAEKAGKEER